MRRDPTIRQLLLGVNIFVILVPIGAIFFLQILDSYLVRQTERRLIAESVMVGEAWRDSLLEIMEQPKERPLSIKAPEDYGKRFVPYEPVLDLSYGVLPPAAPATHKELDPEAPETLAGIRLQPLIERAQVFNLSGVWVTNNDGCVVAASDHTMGNCLDKLQEIRGALQGTYTAVARKRDREQPIPPIPSIRRKGDLSVFTAVPIFLDGKVVGVVRMSRTAVAPRETIWAQRRRVFWTLLVVAVLTPAVSYFFSHQVSKPVRMITKVADALARGDSTEHFTVSGITPSEVRTLSTALENMTQRLTDRADYIQEFASNVSHELKTPLTGITGAIELLQDQWHTMSPAQRARFLENIAEDAARMDRLVTGLLQLARIEGGSEDAEDIQLNPFIRGLLDRYPHTIGIEFGEEALSLRMNPDHLETAVRNLVENAIRHGEEQPILLSAQRDKDRILIRVQDHGPGIPEDNRERVFERFFTTEREHGGTGLGLAIVKAIVETRGGSIAFETSSAGTTFSLTL